MWQAVFGRSGTTGSPGFLGSGRSHEHSAAAADRTSSDFSFIVEDIANANALRVESHSAISDNTYLQAPIVGSLLVSSRASCRLP